MGIEVAPDTLGKPNEKGQRRHRPLNGPYTRFVTTLLRIVSEADRVRTSEINETGKRVTETAELITGLVVSLALHSNVDK